MLARATGCNTWPRAKSTAECTQDKAHNSLGPALMQRGLLLPSSPLPISPGMVPPLAPLLPAPAPAPALCPRCTARQRRWLMVDRNSLRQRGHLWVASRPATEVGLTRAPALVTGVVGNTELQAAGEACGQVRREAGWAGGEGQWRACRWGRVAGLHAATAHEEI